MSFRRWWFRNTRLDAEKRRCWDEQGYLILPRFFDDQEVEEVLSVHERVWRERPARVVVDDLVTRERKLIADVSDEEIGHPHTVNDLFLQCEAIRETSLHPRLVPILHALLPRKAVLINTLSMDYGSEQSAHVDSLYMTPLTPGHLVATWIALEDVSADAGPLYYYPGSHKIEPYVFSNGGRSQINGEQALWQEYMKKEIEKREMKPRSFSAAKGDVFIWHSELLHGGEERADPSLTRKTLVSHYFTDEDCARIPASVCPLNGAFWMVREPQPVLGK